VNFTKFIPVEVRLRWIKVVLVSAALSVCSAFLVSKSSCSTTGKGIGALLQTIGTFYTVLYAFATSVMWAQFTAIENQI